MESQPKHIQPLCKGISAAIPAMLFGTVLGKMNGTALAMNKQNPVDAGPMVNAQFQAMEQMGSANPLRFAANIGTLMFTQTAVTEYSKLQRGTGEEDIWNTVSGAVASGAAFSFVSALGTPAGPTIDAILGTGAMFGAFNALFFQIGKKFGATGQPKQKDVDYVRTKEMLSQLGLSAYEKNFRKGQLDDKCLLLLTDATLAEVKVPPGPRLQILNTVGYYRSYYARRGAGAPPPSAPTSPLN